MPEFTTIDVEHLATATFPANGADDPSVKGSVPYTAPAFLCPSVSTSPDLALRPVVSQFDL